MLTTIIKNSEKNIAVIPNLLFAIFDKRYFS